MLKVNGKTIISYQETIFNLFDEVIIVVGYKKNKIINNFKSNVTYIENTNYQNTNMVHSLFCPSSLIDQDIIFTYSDIIFEKSLIKNLKKKSRSCLPLNYNWYGWKTCGH